MMHKSVILAVEYTLMEQDDAKATREIAVTMVGEACSAADKIKELKFQLAFLKGSDISAYTAQQLEIARQEISDLKGQLDLIRRRYDIAEKEIEV